jgi:alkyl hydroperoxide reductase subunit D
MSRIEELLARLPESGRDARLNLQNVLRGEVLSPQQTWGAALAAAFFYRHDSFTAALLSDAAGVLSPAEIEDAQAAAALMAMNTVYYRSRHMLGGGYESLRPGFRMSRMGSPRSSKLQMELDAMSCAAIAGCEVCLRAHEEALRGHGLTEAQIHESVRIAAAVSGAAAALSIADVSARG